MGAFRRVSGRWPVIPEVPSPNFGYSLTIPPASR